MTKKVTQHKTKKNICNLLKGSIENLDNTVVALKNDLNEDDEDLCNLIMWYEDLISAVNTYLSESDRADNDGLSIRMVPKSIILIDTPETPLATRVTYYPPYRRDVKKKKGGEENDRT